jgi:hypothetical protein
MNNGGRRHCRLTDMGAVLPRKVTWIKSAVAGFEPEKNAVIIEGCHAIATAISFRAAWIQRAHPSADLF